MAKRPSTYDKISTVILIGKSSLLRVWTLDLAFGGFTLQLAKGSNSYILLPIYCSFIWTLNKVWSLNPTTSQLGQSWPLTLEGHH